MLLHAFWNSTEFHRYAAFARVGDVGRPFSYKEVRPRIGLTNDASGSVLIAQYTQCQAHERTPEFGAGVQLPAVGWAVEPALTNEFEDFR